MAYQLHRTVTMKGYGPRDQWTNYGGEPIRRTFASMAEIYEWLRAEYGKAKRAPMYRDTKTGTIKCGWVIGFRNADWSHAPVNHWLQQDWVSVAEIRNVDLDAA